MGTGLEAARLIARTVVPVPPAAIEPVSGPESIATAKPLEEPFPHGPDAWRGASEALRARAVEIAGKARVDLLLSSTLRAAGIHVPEPLATRAAAAKAIAAWAWVEGAAILDALERAGLAPIALKGGDLSARAYPVAFPALPDRAYLRHATDLDVLLANPATAEPVMRREGFELDAQGAAHHVRWRKAGPGISYSVELHDDLFDKPHGLAHAIDAIRGRAVTVPSPDGATRRVLAPADAFLHVAGHALYSDLLRDPVSALRGPIDLAVLSAASPIDADALLGAARSASLDGVLALAVDWCGQTAAWLHGDLTQIGRRAHHPNGLRMRWGARVVVGNGRAALDGAPVRGGPATAWRALLAPSLGSAVEMLREGIRRRSR